MYTLMTYTNTSKTTLAQTLRPENVGLCESIISGSMQQTSEPLSFVGRAAMAKLDYCEIDPPQDAFLGSEQLEAILSSLGLSYRSYPTILLQQSDMRILSTRHRLIVLKPMNLLDCIDWEKSQIWTDSVLKTRLISTFVLNELFQSGNEPIFCLQGRRKIFVHDNVRQELVKKKLKGVGFAPLNSYFSPSLGLEEQHLLTILERNSRSAQNWYNLASIRMQLFRYQAVLEAVEQALIVQSIYPQAWHLYGASLHRLSELEKALQAYEQESMTSLEHTGWIDCCSLLCSLGQPKEGIILAQHHLSNPFWQKIPRGWYQLGLAFMQVQDFQGALKAFEQALLYPGIVRDQICLAKGQTLFGLEYFEEALQAYNQGLELSVTSLDLWEEKLVVLQMLDREKEMVEALKNVEYWRSVLYKKMYENII